MHVTQPSGSMTSADSLVVAYTVRDGSRSAAVRNQDALRRTVTRTDSPTPSEVLAAFTLRSSVHQNRTRSHPPRATRSIKTAGQRFTMSAVWTRMRMSTGDEAVTSRDSVGWKGIGNLSRRAIPDHRRGNSGGTHSVMLPA